jgi:hypothetical protein
MNANLEKSGERNNQSQPQRSQKISSGFGVIQNLREKQILKRWQRIEGQELNKRSPLTHEKRPPHPPRRHKFFHPLASKSFMHYRLYLKVHVKAMWRPVAAWLSKNWTKASSKLAKS